MAFEVISQVFKNSCLLVCHNKTQGYFYEILHPYYGIVIPGAKPFISNEAVLNDLLLKVSWSAMRRREQKVPAVIADTEFMGVNVSTAL